METEGQEELIIAPVPALVAVLFHLEQEKGGPLTEKEVLHARDNAECIAMPPCAHAEVVAARGYEDIDPERAWEAWLEIRPSLYAREA